MYASMQGLDWYASKMKVDEDGDVACDFLNADPPLPPPDPKQQDQLPPQTKEARVEVLMVNEGNVVLGR